jgi:endonuclease/exonuclease/phosphatase family metal-dependent hydrolase
MPAGSGDPGRPLAEAVASLDADVLALQEVDRLQERSGRIDQALVAAAAQRACDWRYASALHGRPVSGQGWVPDPLAGGGLRVYGPDTASDAETPGDIPSHGIALLTRVPVRVWRARRFDPAPLGLPLKIAGRAGLTLVRDQPRAALAAVLAGSGGPFTIVAAHLSFVPGWNVRQLLALRRWIADLPRPHVLLGDLNVIGALPVLALRAAGLPDAYRRADGNRWRDLARTPTYPAHRPVVQFDHILAIGLPPGAVLTQRAPRTAVSDHRPVVVDVTIQGLGRSQRRQR